MLVLKNGFEKWTQSDFDIRGRRTGSRLAGRENQYIYEIFYKDERMGEMMFTSKERASYWLSGWLKKMNHIRYTTYVYRLMNEKEA